MLKKLRRSLIAASFAFVCCFSVSPTNNITLTQQSSPKKLFDDGSSDLLDGLADFISDSGSEFINWISDLSVGGVGKFLCKEAVGSLFSYLLTKDKQDAYVTNIVAVNEKLESMQKDLTNIITLLNQQNEDAKKNESRRAMDSFFNIVDTFSTTVSPIYAGYNDLALRQTALEKREKNGETVTSEEKSKLAKEEETFYERNLKSIVFGNSTSTGDLYLQLINLLDAVIKSSHTRNQTLMENYNATYEHLWAFDTQSFKPKKDFINYVMASLTEGVALYKFQYLYETKINANNNSQLTILKNRHKTYSEKAKTTFEYLKKELNLVNAEEKKSNDNNCVTHLATGKTVSRKLFAGKLVSKEKDVEKDSSAIFSYSEPYDNGRAYFNTGLKFKILNNEKFASEVEKDFKEHKKYYRKDDSYTLKDFLEDAKFTCDDWTDVIGLYHRQDYTYFGNRLNLNKWNFVVTYTDMQGNHKNSQFARAFAGGSRAAAATIPNEEIINKSFVAFVSTNGYLTGSYEDTSLSIQYIDMITRYVRLKSCKKNSANLGKVW